MHVESALEQGIYVLKLDDLHTANGNCLMKLNILHKITRLTFSGLWSQNWLKEGHVLWVDMFFWSACVSG